MDAQNIQKSLTISQIYDILAHMNGQPKWIDDETLISRTICHDGDSHKLYYYDNSKRFTCYTGGCGYGFSIFDLVQKVRHCEFIQSLNFVKNFFGIQGGGEYIPPESRVETSFFNLFEKIDGNENEEDVKTYDKDVLNNFYNIYHQSWIDDNISPAAMRLYNIQYSIATNQIIIPHYNKNNNLIGIRVRNLDEELVESGRKYMPLIHNGEMYNHNTGDFLYGLNVTKNSIKKHKRIILFEGEKSCMQIQTMFPQHNIAVALSGSNLSDRQLDIIQELDTEEVIVALDKEYKECGTREEWLYQREIRKNIIDRLLPTQKVSIIWDDSNLLDYKDSPSDKGKRVFLELYKNRLRIFS